MLSRDALVGRQEGTARRDYIAGISSGEDGSFLVFGRTYGNWTGTNAGGADFIAGKIDSNGTLVWRWQVGTMICSTRCTVHARDGTRRIPCRHGWHENASVELENDFLGSSASSIGVTPASTPTRPACIDVLLRQSEKRIWTWRSGTFTTSEFLLGEVPVRATQVTRKTSHALLNFAFLAGWNFRG